MNFFLQKLEMSSVSVRKSSPVVIRPPEPVTSGTTTIKLTSLDSALVKVPFTALLVFEHPSHDDATETIKSALSEALAHYSPFAGRIISSRSDDGGDGFSIRCTGEGMEFVAASADCGLEEAKIFGESTGTETLLDELAVYYPVGSYGCSGDDPLLSVQVTEFTCGGLVLGVTWSHAIADGVGIGQFLAAVGELARGSPSPSVAPARWDAAVSGLPTLFDAIHQATLLCPEPLDLVACVDVTIPSAMISRVRDKCSNCVANQLVAAAASGAVASAAIVDLVKMIRRAKDQLPETMVGEEDGGGGRRLMQGLRGRYNMLHVSSWRNVGFEQVDLGVGAPARVISHWPGGMPPVPPICMVYPPCKGKDGVNVLSMSMREEHADAFLNELANLCRAYRLMD
ncbi:unnamed protein product [Urochloa decumbens]|uniref:Uncharacterized protein n=1 Tax=Urochloa decumbens TaxID=240449 RepID=A0ABC8VXD7_9POAL